MKILILTAEMDSGGAETHICTLASELVRMGHRVFVSSSGGRMVKTLERKGIKHFKIDMNTHDPIRLLAARLALEKLIFTAHFDIIHAHARIPAYLACGIAKRAGVHFVSTVHAKFCVTPLTHALSRWGERSIAISEDLKQYLCENYGISPNGVKVIVNGVDMGHFCPAPQKHLGEMRIVFLSRLDVECAYGARLLISVAKELYGRYPDIKIIIGGDGGAFENLRCEAERINGELGACVIRLIGHVDRVQELLRSADVFVGVSRAAIEAMACGVPTVLCGDEGALGIAKGEVLPLAAQSNFCCRGYPLMSEKGLLDALASLISLSDRERREIGVRALDYIRENYGSVKMAEQTEAFYNEVLKKSPQKAFGRIVLCGYYGYGNMGDEALLASAVGRAQKRDMSPVVLLHGRPERYSRLGISCVRRCSPFAVMKEIRRADVLAFGGGTLLQDNTSLRSLCFYCALLHFAHRCGVRTELWASGIGVPRTRIGAVMIRNALRRCDAIGVRDKASFRLCERMLDGTDMKKVYIEDDLAKAIEGSDRNRTDFLLKYYGLSDNSLGKIYPFAIIAPRGRGDSDEISELKKCIARALRDNMKLLFVPMFPKEDLVLCQSLCRSCGGRVARALSPSDLVSLMRYSQEVIGMRLHALIFADMAKARYIGLGNDIKIRAFCAKNI